MPFITTALSGTQLTNMRGDYSGRAYVLATPNTVIFKAQVQANTTEGSAVIPYKDVTTGAYTDIRDGQVIITHLNTDDIYDYYWRGRARGSADGTNVNIGVSDKLQILNYYISVIDDYDIMPRVPAYRNDTIYMDYDLAFQRLPPCISGLQSVYAVHTTSTTASLAFAPTVTAMESGASIVSYAWDVGDGTITVGSASTQNVTVSFPAWEDNVTLGHRWVHLTVTDSNGVSHTMHFEVYVGDFDVAEWVLQDVDNVQWSANWDGGYNGSITFHGQGDTIAPFQRVCIAYRDNYDNASTTPINSSVAFIGRLKTDTMTMSGEDYVQETGFDIEGFGTALANLGLPKFAVFDVDTPSQWNDTIDPTPPRAIWHVLTRFSTFGTIASFDFLSAYNDYPNKEWGIEAQGTLDAVNRVAERIVGKLTFAPDGSMRLRQTAHYLTTAQKNALTTIAELTTLDMLDYQVTKTHAPRVGLVEGAGSMYTTSTKTFDFFTSRAPTIMNTLGEEVQTLNGQVLNPISEADAINELGTRTANFFALQQIRRNLSLTLFDSWREIVPSNYEWYTFTLADTENNRGLVISNTTRWLLSSASWSADIATGSLSVSAEFEEEASAFGYANQVVEIPQAADMPNVNLLPILPPYANLQSPDGGEGTQWTPTDTPSTTETNPINPSIGDPARQEFPPEAGCGNYSVTFQGDNPNMRFTSVNGATYTVTVVGSGTKTTDSTANCGSVSYYGGNGEFAWDTLGANTTYDVANDVLLGGASAPNSKLLLDATFAPVPPAGYNNDVLINYIAVDVAWNKTRAGTDTIVVKRDNTNVLATQTITALGAGTATLLYSPITTNPSTTLEASITNLVLDMEISNTVAEGSYTNTDGSYLRVTGLEIAYELRINDTSAISLDPLDSRLDGSVQTSAGIKYLRIDKDGLTMTARDDWTFTDTEQRCYAGIRFTALRRSNGSDTTSTINIELDGVPILEDVLINAAVNTSFARRYRFPFGSYGNTIKVTYGTNYTGNRVLEFNGIYVYYFDSSGEIVEESIDAFYDFTTEPPTDLGVGRGLTINSTKPSPTPDYNPTHTYEYTVTGDGTIMDIVFDDTSYTGNSASSLQIKICGDGAR